MPEIQFDLPERDAKQLPEWAQLMADGASSSSKLLSVHAEVLCLLFRRMPVQLADFCGLLIEDLERQRREQTEREDREPEPPETCGECRFWRLPGIDEGDKTRGDCRCSFPEVTPGPEGSFRRWPVTYRMDWCGEFERKETER